jgi:DnaJ-domain-containing protein 1
VNQLPEEEKAKVMAGEVKLKPKASKPKNEKPDEKKESMKLVQLKHYWRVCNQADRKRFMEYANLKFGGN